MLRATLSVEPHVHHFLKNKFGEPMTMQANNHIGKYFFNLADAQKGYDLRVIKNQLKPYPAELQIVVSQNMFLRNGLLLTEEAIRDFNGYVSDYIFDLFFNTMDFALEFTPSGQLRYDKAIMQFCKLHGLDEDVFTYERAKKAWYRWRKRNNKLIKSRLNQISNSVPS